MSRDKEVIMISPFRHTNDFMVKIVTTFFETIVVIKEYHCRGENNLSKVIDLRSTLGSDLPATNSSYRHQYEVS